MNKKRMVEDDTLLEYGKIERFLNKIVEMLEKYQKQNALLKAKGKFSLQQANYTMKRFAEEFGTYVVKRYIKKSHTCQSI